MAGHAQLKFVMTECSKTQIRLTGHKYKTRHKESQEGNHFQKSECHHASFNIANQNGEGSQKKVDEPQQKQ